MFKKLPVLLAALGAEAYEGDGTMLMQNRVWTNSTTQSTACADGTDDVVFVAGAIVGCDTSWTTPGISSGDAACGSGWWVCPSQGDASNLGLTQSLCSNSAAAGDFYSSKQSSNGGWSCGSGTNDLWGCGKDGNGVSYQPSTCGVFTKAIGNKDYGSWSGLSHSTQETQYVTKGIGNGGVLCCADPSAPTLPPTSAPTPPPTPAPTATPTPAPTAVAATGDPHLQNIHGERFDLMKPGNHVLINIPRGDPAEHALLRVQADARQVGGSCSDMYFQEVNITGTWAEAKQAGGYQHVASNVAGKTAGWIAFGKVDLKVVQGQTQSGVEYLNVYVKHLGQAGYSVGGLLGEDDHQGVTVPPASCHHRTALTIGKSMQNTGFQMHSTAEASLH